VLRKSPSRKSPSDSHGTRPLTSPVEESRDLSVVQGEIFRIPRSDRFTASRVTGKLVKLGKAGPMWRNVRENAGVTLRCDWANFLELMIACGTRVFRGSHWMEKVIIDSRCFGGPVSRRSYPRFRSPFERDATRSQLQRRRIRGQLAINQRPRGPKKREGGGGKKVARFHQRRAIGIISCDIKLINS